MSQVQFQGTANLFFAVRPPERLCPSIERLGADLRRAHGLRGRPITGDRLHNTLAPVHDPRRMLEENIERAKWAAAKVRHSAFPIRFDWTESFRLRPQSHPLVLRGDEGLRSLAAFRQALGAQLVRAGFAVPAHFTPHVTLLWADRYVGANPIAPIGWPVRDFVLTLSLVGQSRHIHLARWPLH